MLFSWYNPLTNISSNYYNFTIGPISTCSDFSRDEIPATFSPESDWEYSDWEYQNPFDLTAYAADPSMIRTPNGYYMAYHTTAAGVLVQIAHANNLPDFTWLSNVTGSGASKPCLVYCPNGTLAIFYQGATPNGIQMKWSDDGITWSSARLVIAVNSQLWHENGAVCPSVLKEPITGTPYQIDGKYWMAFLGANTSEPRGQVGIAYSTNLTDWTEVAIPVITVDDTRPQSYWAGMFGSPEMFVWNDTPYALLNVMNDYPGTGVMSETGYFAVDIAVPTSDDFLNWDLIADAVFTKSEVATDLDGNQHFTGELTYDPLNGTLYYFFNGFTWGDPEKITYASSNPIVPGGLVSNGRLTLGFNRVVNPGYVVHNASGGVSTGIYASTNKMVDINVISATQWIVSGTAGTIVTFTLSGLESGVNSYYDIYVDGKLIDRILCTSGSIIFSYSGLWSEHQFVVTKTKIVDNPNFSGLIILLIIVASISLGLLFFRYKEEYTITGLLYLLIGIFVAGILLVLAIVTFWS
jgi:hypothetical protein